jgi:beta-phosphoglucomutase family hydrolase
MAPSLSPPVFMPPTPARLPRPDAIIFDLDGVLVRSEAVHAAAYRSLFREEGIEISLTELRARSHGTSRRDVIRSVLGTIDEARMERLCRRKAELVTARLSTEPVETVPGAEGLLQLLARERLPVAVATASHMPGPFLRSCGLGETFEIVVHGGMVARNKPAPDVYLEAARRLGVAPNRCLAVDDAPPGIEAARAAGMTVIAVTSDGRDLPGATLAVRDLDQLRAALPWEGS